MQVVPFCHLFWEWLTICERNQWGPTSQSKQREFAFPLLRLALEMTLTLRELLTDLASRLDLHLGEFDLDGLAVALAIRLIMTREGRWLDA